MANSEVEKQFAEYVKLRGYDDKFIDREEERTLLDNGIGQGLSLDEARSIFFTTCEEKGYVTERDIDNKIQEMLSQFAINDGKVDKKEFFDTVAIAQNMSKGKISEPKCKKKVKEILLDNGWNVREGFLKGGNWFASI